MRRMRAAWIDIDLDAIVHNVEEVTNLVRRDRDKNTIPMPIIKGNAYGHGIYEVARVLYQEGITYFGVAIYEEALLVREAAPKGNVLILGYTPDDLAEDRKRQMKWQCRREGVGKAPPAQGEKRRAPATAPPQPGG